MPTDPTTVTSADAPRLPRLPHLDSDVETVAAAIADTWSQSLAEMDAIGPTGGLAVRDDARRILDALAAAGRLAPTDPDALPGPHALVATAGGRTVEHPADCTVATPTGPVLICLVDELARTELADSTLPAGRYEVWAADEADHTGRHLRIGDRLDVDAHTSSTIAASNRFARAAAGQGDDGRDWVRLRTGSGRQYEGHRSATCPGDGVAGHQHDIRCVDQAEG